MKRFIRWLLGHKSASKLDLCFDEQSDTYKQVDYIANRLKEATAYGLEAEVVAWALFGLKQDPSMSVEDAIDYGFDEWVK